MTLNDLKNYCVMAELNGIDPNSEVLFMDEFGDTDPNDTVVFIDKGHLILDTRSGKILEEQNNPERGIRSRFIKLFDDAFPEADDLLEQCLDNRKK